MWGTEIAFECCFSLSLSEQLYCTDRTFYKIIVNDTQDLLRTKSSAIVLSVISSLLTLIMQQVKSDSATRAIRSGADAFSL